MRLNCEWDKLFSLFRDAMKTPPLVTIIIPHYLGEVLSGCLDELFRVDEGIAREVIVVDDRPYPDGSIERCRSRHPSIMVVTPTRIPANIPD